MGFLTKTTEFLNTLLNNVGVNTSLNTITDLTTDTITVGTLDGVVKGATGTLSAATDGTDYLSPSTVQTEVNKNTYLRDLMSTSHISGAELSINTDTSKFDISAGVLRFVDNYTDINNPTVTDLAYTGSVANTITNLATENVTYVSIDSSGTLYQSTSSISGANLRDRVELGVITHPNKTSITSIDSRTLTNSSAMASSIVDLAQATGIINVSGNIYSANGTNLNINKSAGVSYGIGINYNTNPKNPNNTTDTAQTADTFVYEWRDGAGSTKTYTSNTIQPGYYDDNTTGSTTHPNGVVNNNQWTIMPVRFYPASGYTVIDAGQVVYVSQAEAIAAIKDSVEQLAVVTGNIRAWLIIRGGATDLSDSADAVFIEADKFGTTASGAGTGTSTTTLQQAYDNSITPEVVTDTIRGALTIKRGSTADTDIVLEVLNGSDVSTLNITGTGILAMLETTTPTATTNYGKIYTKSDNKLYFQDGAGSEHEIAFV